jgi:hypothetical protein
MKLNENDKVKIFQIMIDVIGILRDSDMFESYLKTTDIETIHMVKENRTEMQSHQVFALLTYLSYLDDYKELLQKQLNNLKK